MDLVESSAPDPLATSDESLYYDAETGEVEPNVLEPAPSVSGVGQMARYDPGAGLAFVDPHGDVPVPPENANYPGDSETAPAEQLVHIAVPPAIPEAPLVVPEDDDENLVFDPLEASPLLDSLGFSRVQSAYQHWLANMSHSISLFQGMFSQAHMMTQL